MNTSCNNLLYNTPNVKTMYVSSCGIYDGENYHPHIIIPASVKNLSVHDFNCLVNFKFLGEIKKLHIGDCEVFFDYSDCKNICESISSELVNSIPKSVTSLYTTSHLMPFYRKKMAIYVSDKARNYKNQNITGEYIAKIFPVHEIKFGLLDDDFANSVGFFDAYGIIMKQETTQLSLLAIHTKQIRKKTKERKGFNSLDSSHMQDVIFDVEQMETCEEKMDEEKYIKMSVLKKYLNNILAICEIDEITFENGVIAEFDRKKCHLHY